MKPTAIILNCTLKQSPEESNTDALIEKVVKEFKGLGVKAEVLRPVDYKIKVGIANDLGKGDGWPEILKKLKATDIVILASPIWFGSRSSVCQLVLERLDATLSDADEETGQYPWYNKVAGFLVTGNEDGAHQIIAYNMVNLMHLGFTIPPNCDSYWLGPAGPGKSYKAAKGDKWTYTNKTYKYLVHNTVWFAQLLQNNPIPTNLNDLAKAAEKESDDEKVDFLGEDEE